MTLKQFKTLLSTSSIPVAFGKFRTEQALPYMIYLTQGENGLKADGIRYSTTTNIRVELYTENKNPATEKALENLLDGAGIFYEKSEELYIETENMYEVIYEMEI